MTTSERVQINPVKLGRVAIAGTDDWLRTAIGSRLHNAGLTIRDCGPGTSSLGRADALILVPRLVTTALNPSRNVGLNINAMTLAAAMTAGITDVVLVSLVGADVGLRGQLGALGLVESRARACISRVTVIRATQVYGTASDPGPLVETMRSALRRDCTRLEKLQCSPVFVADLVDVVEAALYRRLASGSVEMAGPTALTAGEFIFEFDQRLWDRQADTSKSSFWSRLPLARRGDRSLCELLEAQTPMLNDNPSVLRSTADRDGRMIGQILRPGSPRWPDGGRAIGTERLDATG